MIYLLSICNDKRPADQKALFCNLQTIHVAMKAQLKCYTDTVNK